MGFLPSLVSGSLFQQHCQLRAARRAKYKTRNDVLDHVIRRPKPHVLKISRRLGSQVHHHRCSLTYVDCPALGFGRTLAWREVGARRSPKSYMAVWGEVSSTVRTLRTNEKVY